MTRHPAPDGSNEPTLAELRAVAEALRVGPLDGEHCHASVERDGELDACGLTADQWAIFDPETGDDRAWPICYLHASEGGYTPVHRWVALPDAVLGLIERVQRAEAEWEKARPGIFDSIEEMRVQRDAAEATVARARALADEWETFGPFDVVYETTGELVAVLRAALDPAAHEEAGRG